MAADQQLYLLHKPSWVIDSCLVHTACKHALPVAGSEAALGCLLCTQPAMLPEPECTNSLCAGLWSGKHDHTFTICQLPVSVALAGVYNQSGSSSDGTLDTIQNTRGAHSASQQQSIAARLHQATDQEQHLRPGP